MTTGEKIRACRQNAGLSQEKVAELVGVSRQAVTKWEADQSAPNTENLFRLAEIFGVTIDTLLGSGVRSPAEQIYYLYKMEEAEKRARQKQVLRARLLAALAAAALWLILYLIGRTVWCDPSESTLLGWLFLSQPEGAGSYLFGWLLSSRLFWPAMALSCLPALLGKFRFSLCTFAGCVLGLVLGILFGPDPAGAAYGHGHYGWAIWIGVYLLALLAGLLTERFRKTPRRGEPAQ